MGPLCEEVDLISVQEDTPYHTLLFISFMLHFILLDLSENQIC